MNMSVKGPLGLPSITSPLKSIVPYLQRAEEIKAQEPVVAYWCAYYAAQLGISLKAKDVPSRSFLFALLGFLEQMKTEIGPTDAADVDAVGAAYIENFALKVFSAADNEDRNGRATRVTAKKFLAAANFLEVLKTFNNAEISDTNFEKIRYSKWKAADIAKAFREGRKPAPGPPGFSEEQEIANQLTNLQEQTLDTPNFPSASPLTSQPLNPLPPFSRESRTPPIPSIRAPAPYDDEWSTIVAPNASILDPDLIPSRPTPRRSNSGGSVMKSSISGSPRRRAYVSDELEGKRSPSPPSQSPKSQSPSRLNSSKHSSPTRQTRTPSPGSDKKVHFTPSVVGGSFSSGSQPGSPDHSRAGLPEFQIQGSPKSPGFALPPPPPPPLLPTVPPPFPYRTTPPLRSPPLLHHQPALPAHPPVPRRVELTPAVILQVQKRCRLASSALDYEDAATAKKELKAALALLGD